METLKLSLEYQCYPIWHYDSDNNLVNNDLPDKLIQDKELDELLCEIQEIFDNLFTNTQVDFHSNSFKSNDERMKFINKIYNAVNIIKNRYGNSYNIVCLYNNDSFQ